MSCSDGGGDTCFQLAQGYSWSGRICAQSGGEGDARSSSQCLLGGLGHEFAIYRGGALKRLCLYVEAVAVFPNLSGQIQAQVTLPA